MEARILLLLSIVFPSLLFSQPDTINRYDSLGYKTGFWRIKAGVSNHTGYKQSDILEEGRYINNKKEGLWKEFYPNGNLKNELTFKKNRPNGPAKIYYENGCLFEEGYWGNNRWLREYKEYSKDTCGKLVRKLVFDSVGRREGRPVVNYTDSQVWLSGPGIREGISTGNKQACKIHSLKIDVAGRLRLSSSCEIKTVHLLIFGLDGALVYASDSLMEYKGMICLDPNDQDVSYYHVAWTPPGKKKKGYTWAIRYTTTEIESFREEKGKVLID